MKKATIVILSLACAAAVTFASLPNNPDKIKKEVKKENQKKETKRDCSWTCPFS